MNSTPSQIAIKHSRLRFFEIDGALPYPLFIPTISILLLANATPAIFDKYLKIPVIVLCVIFCGVPHGAVDHLLFYRIWKDICLKENEVSKNCCRQQQIVKTGAIANTRLANIRKKPDLRNRQHLISSSHLHLHATSIRKSSRYYSRLFMSTKIKELARYPSVIFYSAYILLMTLQATMWYISPAITFFTFVAMSAYHFGQGDFGYLQTNELDRIKKANDKSKGKIHFPWRLLFLSRGILLMGLIALSQRSLSFPIMYRVTGLSWVLEENVSWPHYDTILLVSVVQHFVILMLSSFQPLLVQDNVYLTSRWKPGIEIFKSILFCLMFHITDLFVAFAIYFGIWHSFEYFFAIKQYLLYPQQADNHLNQKYGNQKSPSYHGSRSQPFRKNGDAKSLFGLITLVIPFTLPVIVVIGYMSFYFQNYNDILGTKRDWLSVVYNFNFDSFWPAFIVTISTLTTPHMFLVEMFWWWKFKQSK
ncbi:beta-carotene 15,15'-dioxygenase-domain-containing protein [Paraphysoderma sedebokerense]|nr:beta-carotene 15,15'-dioxygenase-domain-containing protein [Paraphysoderma sedebokerense]